MSKPQSPIVEHEYAPERLVLNNSFGNDSCNDPKENAEHVMLVDLARNDLSRNCHGVKV